MQPHTVEERRRRTAHGRDDDVAGLLEGQADRCRYVAQQRARLIVQEDTARGEHRGDIAHRQRQLPIVEVGQDVCRHDEIERPSVETFGHDVQRLGLERAGGSRADANGAAQVAVDSFARRGGALPSPMARPSRAK